MNSKGDVLTATIALCGGCPLPQLPMAPLQCPGLSCDILSSVEARLNVHDSLFISSCSIFSAHCPPCSVILAHSLFTVPTESPHIIPAAGHL